ncbi:MAG: TIGR01777 family oxidoreductase [Pirellulaceae bacterium]
MKVIIPGGSGQVGTLLARAFVADGHEVVMLSRKLRQAPWKMVRWDGETVGDWKREFDGADVVINLAGRSVNCRYHAANRRAIVDSRVNSTRAVGEAIAKSKHPPRVWLQASTATIYADRYDEANDERTGILGGEEPNVPDTWKFSIDVAKAWEQAAEEANTPQTRKVMLRSAMTMSPDARGIFDTLLGLVRRGLGGTCGNGRQYVSWIHERDFVQAVYWLIEQEVTGPVNLTAPNPLPNAEFMRVLRQAWGTRIGLPATKWMLEIGAFFLRTESELILKSRRVVPGRLLDAGFQFDFPDWPAAAVELCERWRRMRRSKNTPHSANVTPILSSAPRG